MSKIDYARLHEFATEMGVDYNLLCQMVRNVVGEPPPVGVTDAMVDRAMRARIPGGSEAWVWLFNCEGGMAPADKHRDWFRRILEAALREPAALPVGEINEALFAELVMLYMTRHDTLKIVWGDVAALSQKENTPILYTHPPAPRVDDAAVEYAEALRAILAVAEKINSIEGRVIADAARVSLTRGAALQAAQEQTK